MPLSKLFWIRSIPPDIAMNDVFCKQEITCTSDRNVTICDMCPHVTVVTLRNTL